MKNMPYKKKVILYHLIKNVSLTNLNHYFGGYVLAQRSLLLRRYILHSSSARETIWLNLSHPKVCNMHREDNEVH